jgi:nitroreductase
MEFRELIQRRYSVRAYKAIPVEEEKLQQVLEAARLAPTAANRQAFRLIVIRTEGREAELKRIYRRSGSPPRRSSSPPSAFRRRTGCGAISAITSTSTWRSCSIT